MLSVPAVWLANYFFVFSGLSPDVRMYFLLGVIVLMCSGLASLLYELPSLIGDPRLPGFASVVRDGEYLDFGDDL